MVRLFQFSKYLFSTLAMMCFAMPAFAQDAAGSGSLNLSPIAVGIGMGIAAGLCGLGQGRATASATEALARNPGARAGIQFIWLIGLVFMESLTLFTFALLFVRTH